MSQTVLSGIVVPKLSTQAFIRCFHRFTGRRGILKKMISDNALTFKAASGHIARVKKFKKFLSLKSRDAEKFEELLSELEETTDQDATKDLLRSCILRR